jgi:nucleoredoxin
MEEIIGKKFITCKNEEVDPQKIYSCKLICLFFTASWCSPCEIFSKELHDIYNHEANQGEKLLEIIQVNLEKQEIPQKQIIAGDKPWVFIPLNDPSVQKLTTKFEVDTVPYFLVIDSNGKIVSNTGRKDIVNEGAKIVDIWLDLVGHKYE